MPPEFFLDRNLGRRVAEGLRACGWTVHRIGDVFPDDGQDVADEEWIAHGLDQPGDPACPRAGGSSLLPRQPAVAQCRDGRAARRAP
ncbi:hypothetical protein N4P33_20240 [Streptomyces sp. 15-116A]|uniref:PIN-like domain-containing protein n=1 Tax=Streptomyces sp. 15-116A TaxID=2259035 RepID=UPI0021B43B04|nr:hypothetical protein [Streptomyces sp. 15-116A]MCT7354467.1 hypothetical protein [Streptomyces sp. 15-116A]